MTCRLVVLFVVVLLPSLAAAQQGQKPPVRSITQVTGDLYRVQNNQHYTVFLVTSEGIILADPISADLSTWLKAQLAEKFPNRPVRYVMYSHHHQDHASGAAVWNDTAEVIGHDNFAAAVKAAAPQDTRYAAVMLPESTYRDRRTITLGGRRADLIHPGRMGHAPDFTVLHFPAERAVFVVDYVAVRTVPGSNTLQNGASIAEYVNAIEAVEALDFDIAVPGHGPIGKKSDVADHRQYFERLAERVAAAIKAGRTLEQIQAAQIMAEYKDWIEYDEDNDINIANAYKNLSAQRR
ncbi:MAG: MBL fold metallo-hydrolase [Acidobacteria bacterium]|nr:MBL fold metallo-hydrolase [Acidobacteriota bacterium]